MKPSETQELLVQRALVWERILSLATPWLEVLEFATFVKARGLQGRRLNFEPFLSSENSELRSSHNRHWIQVDGPQMCKFRSCKSQINGTDTCEEVFRFTEETV